MYIKYSTLLKQQNYTNFPKQLLLIGKIPKTKSVAIVGTRKPTAEGIEVTSMIVESLVQHDVTIISGLARGIDSSAHRSAIKYGGKTIAVLPCGIEVVYPASNFNLAKQIVETGGGLVSEYHGKYMPKPYDFLARNRIIAGLADLVIIVEAGLRSGSINTAHHALEMGIDVMAVPGSILSPMSVGTNRLIAEGAIPITDVVDVLEKLGLSSDIQPKELATNKNQKLIIEALKRSTLDFNELQQACHLEIGVLQAELSELEISGAITRLPGNYLKLRA